MTYAYQSTNRKLHIIVEGIAINHGGKVRSQLINVSINGEPMQLPGDHSIAVLLDWLKISGDRVAVELNRSIVRKRDWEQTTVSDGSQIEIVEFVGGG